MNKLVITKGDDGKDDVWNEYNSLKVSNRKHGKFTKRIISDDEKKDMISRMASRKFKDLFSRTKTET